MDHQDKAFMNIQVIHEHSVDMDLLPKKATILDLGCRGMEFTNHFRGLGHTVHAVDIDDLQRTDYDRCAITNYTGYCGITHFPDPQATRIGPGASIPCFTLEDYMKLKGVDFFDLIKMDVESEEINILTSLNRAPARMLSVEFHAHLGQTFAQIQRVVNDLRIRWGYEAIEFDWTEAHCAGFNAWDCLFVLKN